MIVGIPALFLGSFFIEGTQPFDIRHKKTLGISRYQHSSGIPAGGNQAMHGTLRMYHSKQSLPRLPGLFIEFAFESAFEKFPVDLTSFVPQRNDCHTVIAPVSDIE